MIEWIDRQRLLASLELFRLSEDHPASAVNNLVLDHVVSMVNSQRPAHEHWPEMYQQLAWKRRRMRESWLGDYRRAALSADAVSLLNLDDVLIHKYEQMIAEHDGPWHEDFMFGVLEAAGCVIDDVMDPGR